MPSGSRGVVQKVFIGVLEAAEKEEHYDPDQGTSSRKAMKFFIEDYSNEAALIANTLERGLSVTHATVLLNEHRKAHNLRSVSWSAGEKFSLRSKSIKKYTQWWEPGAQEYLRDVLKFPLDRQMRCEKETNRGD